MPRDPVVYADMLAERLRTSKTQCWLVNTGWCGGSAADAERMPIEMTRSLLKAALEGSLDGAPMTPHPVFGVHVPSVCPGVSDQLLDPRSSWADPADYDVRAAKLAEKFAANFEAFAGRVSPEVAAAGPVRLG